MKLEGIYTLKKLFALLNVHDVFTIKITACFG